MKKTIKLFIKIVLSIVIVLFILSKIDINKTLLHIRTISLTSYFLGFILISVGMFLSSFKWLLLLKNIEINIPFSKALKFYYIGSFFNMFMPTSLGGDVVRVAFLGKEQKKITEVGLSVFTERLLGLLALLSVAIAAFWLNYSFFKETFLIYLFIFFMVLELFIIIFLIKPKVAKILFSLFITISTLLKINIVVKLLIKVYKSILKIHKNPKRVILAIVLSFVFQAISVFVAFVIAEGLSLNISINFFFLFAPIISLVAMLPISFNGVGLREAVSIYLYGQLGINPEKAVTLSLVIFSLLIINSLLGGLVFLFSRNKGLQRD